MCFYLSLIYFQVDVFFILIIFENLFSYTSDVTILLAKKKGYAEIVYWKFIVWVFG